MKIIKYVCVLVLLTGLCSCVEEGGHKFDKIKASNAYMHLGVGYLQNDELSAAKIPLQKAIEFNPKNAEAYAVLALVFQQEKEFELAEKNFKKALRIDAKNPRILNNYGSFLYVTERYAEAMTQFEKAANDYMYVDRVSVLENMGLTALRMNQIDLAKSYFQRAINLNRRQGRSLVELAEICYKSREYKTADEHYKSFVNLVDDNFFEQSAHTLALGIKIAKANNDLVRSASYGVQLRRSFPNSPEYQQYMAEIENGG